MTVYLGNRCIPNIQLVNILFFQKSIGTPSKVLKPKFLLQLERELEVCTRYYHLLIL